MGTEAIDKTTALPADETHEDLLVSGFDPYLSEILSESKRPFAEERRRRPRTKTPSGRRALLLTEGKRRGS
jgi:hypothetical protein